MIRLIAKLPALLKWVSIGGVSGLAIYGGWQLQASLLARLGLVRSGDQVTFSQTCLKPDAKDPNKCAVPGPFVITKVSL